MVEKIPLRKTIARLDFPAIIAFGNPLLDVLVILKNDELIKKYNLKIDGEMELCEKKLQELIADLPPELMNTFVRTHFMLALYVNFNFSKCFNFNFFVTRIQNTSMLL